MPELSDCSASLTKEDIKNFEVELNVKIPTGMKNFYLKFNGGMPSPYCYQPQDEDLTDEWDENASREYNFETNTRYIAQSFNYFINHFIEEEE